MNHPKTTEELTKRIEALVHGFLTEGPRAAEAAVAEAFENDPGF